MRVGIPRAVVSASHYSPGKQGTFFKGDFSLWEQILQKAFSDLLTSGKQEGIFQLGKPIKNGVCVVTAHGDSRIKNLMGIHLQKGPQGELQKVECITSTLHPKNVGVIGVLSLAMIDDRRDIPLDDYWAQDALSALKKFDKTGRRVFFKGDVAQLKANLAPNKKNEARLLVVTGNRSVSEVNCKVVFTQTVSDRLIYLDFESDEKLPENGMFPFEINASDEVLSAPLSERQMQDDLNHIHWRLLVKHIGMEIRTSGATFGYVECREELRQLSRLIPKTSTKMEAVYVEFEEAPRGITLTKIEFFDSLDMEYFDEGKYSVEAEAKTITTSRLVEKDVSPKNSLNNLVSLASHLPKQVFAHQSYLGRHVAGTVDEAKRRARWVFRQQPSYPNMSYFLGTIEGWSQLLRDSLNSHSSDIAFRNYEKIRIPAEKGEGHKICVIRRGENPTIVSIKSIEVAFISKGNAVILSHAVPMDSRC